MEIGDLSAHLCIPKGTMNHRPNELAEKRAQDTGDCRLWTCKDALLACLRDIESGEINPEKLVVHYTELDENTVDRHYSYYCAGVSTMEHAGMLAHAMARIIYAD
jgi:hypothetical protein